MLKRPSGIPADSDFLLEKRFLTAGTHFPMHWHDFIEMEFIISGNGTHHLNDITYTITPGSCHIMSERDFHAITALTDVTLYCIHFNQNILPRELRLQLSFKNLYCHFEETQMNWIMQLFDHLQAESKNTDSFCHIQQKNLLFQLFIEIIRKIQPISSSLSAPVLEAISYINENFQNPLTLQKLAGHYGFSPNYFGHIFKTQTGQNFNDYLMSVRIQYACRLLSCTALATKEIAFSSGFQSVEYFFKLFKRYKGITPVEYRNHST